MIPDSVFIWVSFFLAQRPSSAHFFLPRRCHSTWRNAIDESGNPHEDPLGLKNHHQKIKNITTTFHGLAGCVQLFGDTSMHLPGCAAMWHKDVFNGWPEFVEGLTYEDLTLTARAIMLGRVHVISDKLVKYRTSPNAVSNYTRKDIFSNIQSRREFERRKYLSVKSWLVSLIQLEIDINAFFPNKTFSRKCSRQEVDEIISELNYKIDRQRNLVLWNDSNFHPRVLMWIFDSRCLYGRLSLKGIKFLSPPDKIGHIQIFMERILKKIREFKKHCD